jgi:integrase
MIDALNQRGLSPKTVREAHMVLSRSLKQAVRWRLIIFNPAQDAVLPKKVRKEMKTLTPQQAQKFLSTAAKNPFGIILICFETCVVVGASWTEYSVSGPFCSSPG